MSCKSLFLVLSASLASSSATAQNPAQSPAPPVITRPANDSKIVQPRAISGTCPALAYPQEARRLELEGQFRARVEIGPDGSIVEITIYKSSGHKALDEASLSYVQSCKYSPGTVDGEPRRMGLPVTYNWKLEPPASATAPASAARERPGG
ncbi:energy transducer TonB [Rubrivivax sp. A210]|uniref:energy transducer TonB n=1 Tax=Rubrivivax sp. A210 TaxID=2772301 RepID=UPI00191B5355